VCVYYDTVIFYYVMYIAFRFHAALKASILIVLIAMSDYYVVYLRSIKWRRLLINFCFHFTVKFWFEKFLI